MDHSELRKQTFTNTMGRRRTHRLANRVAALVLSLACVSNVLARQGADHSVADASITSSPHVAHLVFSGDTGTVGMEAHHTDRLVFAEGTFHSRECEKLGFEKSTVRLARDGDVVRFSAVNVSDEFGTLTWRGEIRDGIVEARYVWKKERLFWTIQREYWFSGEIDDVRD